MKTLACVFGLMVSGAALGNNLFPLQVPQDVPKGNQPSARVCVARTFNADDSSTGTCNSSVAGISSGRSGGGVPVTVTVFVASWDAAGNVLSDQQCGTAHVLRAHPTTWVYAPGFNATTCYFASPGYPDILVYDAAYGYEIRFGYVTTSPDGAYELLTLGSQGYINQF